MKISLKTDYEQKGRCAEVTLDDGTRIFPDSILAYWEKGNLKAHVTTDGTEVTEEVDFEIPDDEEADIDLNKMKIREGAFYTRLIRMRRHLYQEIDRTRRSADFEDGDRLFHSSDLESLLTDVKWFEDMVRSMAQFQKQLDQEDNRITRAQKDFTRVLNAATGAAKAKEDASVEDHVMTFIDKNLHGKIARDTKKGARKLRKITPVDVFGLSAQVVNR